MGCIYKITNDINDKVYIGQTRQPLDKRWSQHKYSSKTQNTALYKAMREYGIEHFKIEVLIDNLENSLLDDLRFFIQKYNSYNNGYNSTLGGQGDKREKEHSSNLEQLSKENLLKVWQSGKYLKQIAKELDCHKRTCSYWLKFYGIATQEEINKRGQDYRKNLKSMGYCHKVQILFEDKTYSSITELAEYLHETNEDFMKRPVLTIVKGISGAINHKTKYLGYSFKKNLSIFYYIKKA